MTTFADPGVDQDNIDAIIAYVKEQNSQPVILKETDDVDPF